MRRKWKRALSLLCTLAMIAGMLPVSSLAAAGQAQTVDGGINGYAAAMQADEVTSGGWRTAFVADGVSGAQEIDGTYRSSALNGKIWTDKSVSIGDNNDFDVTFSALGQTFASSNTTQEQIAFDVVFVVDVSISMNDSNKIQDTVSALNSASDKLMENPNNRMAVVTFAADSSEMVGLAHYEKSGNIQYFSYQTSGWGDRGTLHFTASGTNASANLAMWTNQQSGFFEAKSILEEATIPSGPTRIPVVILLTDGDPQGDDFTQYYKDGNRYDGSADAENVSSIFEDYYYTICTAAYSKDQVEEHYQILQNNDPTVEAKYYTIGLGLNPGTEDRPSDAAIMLDPARRTSSRNNNLSGAINSNSTEKMGFSTYNYADGCYIGEEMDVEEVFDNIIGSITSITGGASAGETVGGRDKITYLKRWVRVCSLPAR